jgi:hypothetical protein
LRWQQEIYDVHHHFVRRTHPIMMHGRMGWSPRSFLDFISQPSALASWWSTPLSSHSLRRL